VGDAVGAIEQALMGVFGLNTIAPFRRRRASLPRNLSGDTP
jgi:uncharacterized membrane protein YuzA (DUF378 family)